MFILEDKLAHHTLEKPQISARYNYVILFRIKQVLQNTALTSLAYQAIRLLSCHRIMRSWALYSKSKAFFIKT